MKITWIALLLLTLSAAPATAQETTDAQTAAPKTATPDAVMMLRMRDGSTRWGSIETHDPDGIQFTLLSHGGSARVRWSLMDPNQETALREKLGYVDVSSEELLIDADVIKLRTGEEIGGVILSREGDNFTVKTGGNLQLIPKIQVQGVSSGHRVPALDVYSREELYGQYLALTPIDDAAAQLELAKTCEKILDFSHAVEHYKAAQTIDAEFNPQEVEFALTRALVKAEQQEQIDYLRNVDHLRKRKKFDEALAKLSAFEGTFPDSPLFLDAKKKEARVLKARDDAIRVYVVRRWHGWLTRLAREHSKTSYTEIIGYIDEELPQEILANVLADVRKTLSAGVEEEHIRAFWLERKKVRYQLASYGLGTWLLGEADAHAGIDEEEEAAEPTSATDAARKKLEDKISRFLKNQTLARKAKSRQDQEGDYEKFWDNLPPTSRAQWIRAYYAERSGDMDVKSPPRISNCPSCAGTGAREVVYVGGGGKGSGGSQLVKCPTCQGVAIVRRIYYR